VVGERRFEYLQQIFRECRVVPIAFQVGNDLALPAYMRFGLGNVVFGSSKSCESEGSVQLVSFPDAEDFSGPADKFARVIQALKGGGDRFSAGGYQPPGLV
jgi:hypothetical protein